MGDRPMSRVSLLTLLLVLGFTSVGNAQTPQVASKSLPVLQAPSKAMPVAQAPSKALPTSNVRFSCSYKHFVSGENRSCVRTDTHSGSDNHYCAVHGYGQQSGW